MKRSHKLLAIVLAALMLLHLSGCLNPVSLDKYGYVMTVGVDEGKVKKYEIVLVLQRESSGESVTDEGGAIILSDEGDTIFEAVNTLYQRLSYELNFSRTHLFVFGKGIAKSGGMEEFFSISLDKLRIRQSAMVMVCDCGVKDFLGGRGSNNEANLTKVQENLLTDEKTVGQIVITNLAKLFEACDGGRFDVAMTYGYINDKILTDAKQKDNAVSGDNPIADAKGKVGGMQSYMKGAALFDGWKMVDTLSAHDTQILNIASGRFKSGSISLKADTGEQYALLAQLDDYSVSIDMDDGVNATISLTISITIEQDLTKELGSQWEKKGKKMVTDYFTDELMRIAKRCQKYKSDALGLGRAVSRKFKTVREWEDFDWKQVYPDADIEFEVDVILSDYYIAITRQ